MARSLMKGSATLWIGTAVITRTSVSVRAVSAPRSISAFMMVPSMPMLSASARLTTDILELILAAGATRPDLPEAVATA